VAKIATLVRNALKNIEKEIFYMGGGQQQTLLVDARKDLGIIPWKWSKWKTRRCVEWGCRRREERGQNDENYYFYLFFQYGKRGWMRMIVSMNAR
jgi:hypothetical protein